MMLEELYQAAVALYSGMDAHAPGWYARRLMHQKGLPMHCPEHHFIVPAALLLAAHKHAGTGAETVQKDLRTALLRAQTVPGGFCGNCGCCGAGIGTGIFLAIWYDTNPKSEQNWALTQRMTARALDEIATVEGPRCCKRVTFLALSAANAFCKQELGLALGEEADFICGYYPQNRECRGRDCPYYPRRAEQEGA